MNYSYDMLVAKWETRRKSNDYKPFGNNGKIYKVGDTIKYKLYDTFIATVYPDDTVELTAGSWISSMTTYTRISNMFLPRACYVTSDKTNHRNKEQPVRLARYAWCGSSSYNYPYTDGVRIKMSNGDILNPEILVDVEKVRTTDKTMALEMRRKLTPLRKLTKVMAKMGALEKPEGYKWNYNGHQYKIDSLNLEAPSANDAQFILELGYSCSDVYYYERKDNNFPFDRVIDNGLKAVREKFYRENNAYSYEVVRHAAAA